MDEGRTADERSARGLRQLANLAAGSGCAGLVGGHVVAILAMFAGATREFALVVDIVGVCLFGAGVVAQLIAFGILLRLRSVGAKTPHWAWILLSLGAVGTLVYGLGSALNV